jgi:hypothetical protein
MNHSGKEQLEPCRERHHDGVKKKEESQYINARRFRDAANDCCDES